MGQAGVVPPALQIELLGGLRVAVGDAGPIQIGYSKALALLAYLAVSGRPARRETLAGLLWGEFPEEDARANLRVVLTALRRALDPYLAVTRETIVLDPAAPCRVDVAAFLEALAGGDAELAPGRLSAAVALYRGDFLAGFTVPGAPAFEEWVAGQRERLRHLAMGALHALALDATARRAYGAGIDALTRLLVLDPWREDTHRQLMALLALSGQRDAALAQYRACQRLLAAELGVEPAEETQALAARIAAGSFPAAPARSRPGNLPVPPTRLIGREGETERIGNALAEGACRLATLVGPGGVGKTRLALAVGALLEPAFADGATFVDLAPISDPGLVPGAIATALGVRTSEGVPLLDALAGAVRDRQLLLVLDNCEQVLLAAPAIATLLGSSLRLAVLATSRAPLHLRGEQEFPIAPLPLPDPDPTTATALAGNPSVALFVQRARATRPDFALTDENAAAVAAICIRLDGLPLALELAAARTKTLSPSALLARLDPRLPLLTGGASDLAARQRTLRASIDWSHGLLSADEQALFRRLGVFVGGGDLDAAQAVATEGGADDPDLLDRLASLVDKNLVQQTGDAAGAPRFAMLETIREYAAERLAAAPEAGTIRHRHAAHFAALAEAAQAGGPARLDREWDNLRAAFAFAGEQGAIALGLRLATALGPIWKSRGCTGKERSCLDDLLAAATGAAGMTAAIHGGALMTAGILAQERGEGGLAIARYEAALALQRRAGDDRAAAAALNHLGTITYEQGAYDRATALHEEALELQRAADDRLGRAQSLNHLGILAANRSDLARARTLYEEALALHRVIGFWPGAAQSLDGLGVVAAWMGDYARATTLHSEALALRRALGDQGRIAYSLEHLGRTATAQGDYARATALHTEALALRRALEARRGIAWSLGLLADLASRTGDHARAEVLHAESLALHREVGNRAGAAEVLASAGVAASRRGDHAAAAALFREGLALWHQVNQPAGPLPCLEGLAVVAAACNRPASAARFFAAAATARRSFGRPLAPADRAEQDRAVAAVREALRETQFAAAWAAGTQLPFAAALAAAADPCAGLDSPAHPGL